MFVELEISIHICGNFILIPIILAFVQVLGCVVISSLFCLRKDFRFDAMESNYRPPRGFVLVLLLQPDLLSSCPRTYTKTLTK